MESRIVIDDCANEQRAESEYVRKMIANLSTRENVRHCRGPYSSTEDRLIVKWILSKSGRYMEIGGRELWKQAERENITGQHRTWQSLKERFIKHIIPYLGEYVKDEQLRTEIMAFMHKRRRQKIMLRAEVLPETRKEDEMKAAEAYKQRKCEVDYNTPPEPVTISQELKVVRSVRSSSAGRKETAGKKKVKKAS